MSKTRIGLVLSLVVVGITLSVVVSPMVGLPITSLACLLSYS